MRRSHSSRGWACSVLQLFDLLYSDPGGLDKRCPPLTGGPVCLLLSQKSQQSPLSGQLNAASLPVRRDYCGTRLCVNPSPLLAVGNWGLNSCEPCGYKDKADP